MITNILALWEAQDPDHFAVKKAIEIAKRSGANLHVLACVLEEDYSDAASRDITHLSENIHAETDALCPAEISADIAIRLHHDVAQAVNEVAEELGIDLVIAASSAHAKGDHEAHIWDLIRNTRMPLLLVTRQTRKVRPTVLATIDIDDDAPQQRAINANVLTWAQHLASLFRQNVDAMSNIPMARLTMEFDVFQPGDILHRDGEKYDEALQRILLDNAVDVDETIVTAGDTASNINKTASTRKADLMVVGSVGRKGLKGFLLGNTVENVLKHARSNVLVVRPEIR